MPHPPESALSRAQRYERLLREIRAELTAPDAVGYEYDSAVPMIDSVVAKIDEALGD